MPNRKPKSHSRPAPPPIHPHPPIVHEVIDPRWILSALGGVVLFSMFCAYIVVCTIFYRGQWQLMLQPTRTVSSTPAALGLPFTEVHFADDATGQPQLDGWWIPSNPSDPSGSAARPTILFLHNGQGSIADALPTARQLHDAQLNVLLFDYRGFGRSGGQHPTESLMQADAASAFRYLTGSRSLPESSIVVFGSGVGGSLAVNLCAAHSQIPALILESPDGDFESRARQDSRSHMVPVRLLFNQNFPLAAHLHDLKTPKLLISFTPGQPPPALQQAANPKTTLELPSPTDSQPLQQAIHRFLATYLTQPPNL